MNIIKDLGQILSEEEIDKLSNSIKQNRNLWTHESVYWGKDHSHMPINFLGSPIYPAKSMPGLYRKLRPLTQQYLVDATSTLLSRVLQLLIKLYNVSLAEQLPDTSLPGFHVITSSTKFHAVYDYHQDADYLEYYEDFGTKINYNFDNFYSFTVAIELPKSGGTVDFKTESGLISHQYKIGHAYTWKSDIWHRIGDVILENENEYRITYQGHFIIQADKLLYYW